MNKPAFLILLLAVSMILISCSGSSAQTSPTSAAVLTPSPIALDLATPVASEPAAGICAQAEGEVGEVVLEPDMPNPRCLKVTGSQRLKVINDTSHALAISLGAYVTSVEAEQETTLDLTFNQILLPGVHRLSAEGYVGDVEIWLAE